MRVKVAVPIAQAVDEVRGKVLSSAETVEEQITGETDWETVSIGLLLGENVITHIFYPDPPH
jgi:hypothetical protein